MLVVKTTSPAMSPSPAKLQPWKAAPSSRTSVALLPDGQAASGTDPATRSAAHRLYETRQREFAAEDQICVQCGEGRLVAEETGRSLFHWQLFLFGGVGRVVCRNEVEDAVAKGQLEVRAVVLGPERWVDAVESVESRDEIFCQSQVVGSGVGADVGPVPEKSDQGGREGCGDVSYVHPGPCLCGEDEGRHSGYVLRTGRGAWNSGE